MGFSQYAFQTSRDAHDDAPPARRCRRACLDPHPPTESCDRAAPRPQEGLGGGVGDLHIDLRERTYLGGGRTSGAQGAPAAALEISTSWCDGPAGLPLLGVELMRSMPRFDMAASAATAFSLR